MDLSILWNVGPEVIPGFDRPNKYALLFITGIILGYYIVKRIYTKEKIEIKELDNLLMWVVVSTIVGARLGHVFFYEWDYYSQHLTEIPAVWKGGLASHGAAIAIPIAVILYRRFSSKMPIMWTLDRVVIAVAIAGCFIRLGNLANSEIKGKPSDGAMSMVFVHNFEKSMNFGEYFSGEYSVTYEETGEDTLVNGVAYPEIKVDVKFAGENNDEIRNYFMKVNPQINNFFKERNENFEFLTINTNRMPNDASSYIRDDGFSLYFYMIPRTPTQIIEAVGYLLIFLVLFFLYWKSNSGRIPGFIFGAFLIGIFGFRFFVEYLKEGQADRDAETIINTGQMLSIPFVILGIYFVARHFKQLKKGYPAESVEQEQEKG